MMDTTKKQSIWEAYRFPIVLFGAIIIGSIIGIVHPGLAKSLKPFGDIFINLMFTIVVPLVFCTISSAIAGMADLKRLGKILGYLFLVFAVTGLIASVLMIFITHIFPPAAGLLWIFRKRERLKRLELRIKLWQPLPLRTFPS